jgi:hypothetical protein
MNGILDVSLGEDGDRGREIEYSNLGVEPSGLVEVLRLKEAIVDHPIVGKELGHVVSDRVGHDDDDTRASWHLLADLDGSDHGGSTGASTEQALLADEATGHGEGRSVLALDPLVDESAIQDVGDEIVADSLDHVRSNWSLI